MNNQSSSTDPTINPAQIDRTSNFPQRSSLLIPILLAVSISAGVFGLGGYYVSKTLLNVNSSKTNQVTSSEEFSSETQKPEPNALYRGTVKILVQTSALKTE